MRLWPVIAMVALSAIGCGSPGSGTVPIVTPPNSALVSWQVFPAGQYPRPIVWLANYSPANGFSSGDGKIALMPGACWKGGLVSQSGNGGAGVSTDGRSLVWGFAGTPSVAGPCGADYKGVVAESPSAVAVALQVIPHASPGDLVACPAIAQE